MRLESSGAPRMHKSRGPLRSALLSVALLLLVEHETLKSLYL